MLSRHAFGELRRRAQTGVVKTVGVSQRQAALGLFIEIVVLLTDRRFLEVVVEEGEAAANELGDLLALDEGELGRAKGTRESTRLLILVTERM
jgi:hypothetical protein